MSSITDRVEFPNAEGDLLAARLERPIGRATASAIFAHCFTCSKESRAATRIARALSAQGIEVLRFDFTGLGQSEGDFANTNFSSNVEDLVSAAAFMRARGAPPSLLVGHSLGGAAVLAAARSLPEVRAIVTIGAPSDPGHVVKHLGDHLSTIAAHGSALVELAGRTFTIKKQFVDDLQGQRLQAIVSGLDAAVLVMHSPVDHVVSVDHAATIYQALKHPKSFISLDGADHLLSNRADAEYVAAVLAAWASRYLPVPFAPTSTEGQVVVQEMEDGKFTQRIQAGRHIFPADEPTAVGGRDAGPTPYDLLLSSLGACTSMTLRMYADRKAWSLDQVAVTLKHGRVHAEDCTTCESGSGQVDRIERAISLDGDLTSEQRSRLLEIADRCPVHRTLMGEKEILTHEAPLGPSVSPPSDEG